MNNTDDEDLPDQDRAPTLGPMFAHYGPHEIFTAIAGAVAAVALIAWVVARRQ